MLYLCFLMGLLGVLHFVYKVFLQPLLTYTSPGWFPFLSVTNITKLERLHRAASRTISCCLSSSLTHFSSLRRLYFFTRVTLTHFMSEPSSPNHLSYFKFGQTCSEIKTLQISLENIWVHLPAHASFYFP